MTQDFKLPDLGEGIHEGDVVQVLVSEGDTIKPDQPVVEIETDKAVLEVPCPFGGKVTKVHVKVGDQASVGSPLVSVETNAQAPAKAEASGPQAPPAAPKKESRQAAAKPAEASKPAEPKGAEKPQAAPPRKPPEKEKPAAREAGPEARKPKAEDEHARVARSAGSIIALPSAEEQVPAGPATRRLARELGVDLRSVAAMFKGERLTEDHVKAYVREGRGVAHATGGPAAEPPLPDFAHWGPIERVALSSLQRKSAEHMSAAWSAPHVTQFDVADITALELLRQRYRQRGPGSEVKLTVTAFVLKAAATALKAHPNFNSSLDTATYELVLKQYYHIGVAVDTEAGLIVPVVRNVDQKHVLEIASELDELADRTRRRKVKPEELRGGTFTVTNLGGIGGTAFTPIINHPQVAILGLARSREEPVVKDERLTTRLVLPLCLSYDHRVINGADGARFIRKLATLLEDPELLLLEG